MAAKLLCVGEELTLLETRCAVLSHNGYDARSAVLQEAEGVLSAEQFDLVIVSATLNAGETGRIVSEVGESRTIVLQGLTFARDLLAEVEQRLAWLTPDEVAILSTLPRHSLHTCHLRIPQTRRSTPSCCTRRITIRRP